MPILINARELSIGAFASLAICGNALAWGPDGHETVGKLADSLIKGTHAATKVKQTIGMSLEQASVWADCAKGVDRNPTTGKFAYGGAGRFPECKEFETSQGKASMVAFVTRNWTQCVPKPWEETCHRQYHYSDVANQHGQYQHGLVGTSDHDIVASISAAVRVLQGGTSPVPIQIASKREALLLLAHYVGDVHQPLHVEAVYLSGSGQIVDPDVGVFDPATRTVGGNSIKDRGDKLHHEWDTVPLELTPAQVDPAEIDEARAVPMTIGNSLSWSAQWATDTIHAASVAFADVMFSAEDPLKTWQATLPGGYAANRALLQRAQIIKAGARLAQVLQTIWP